MGTADDHVRTGSAAYAEPVSSATCTPSLCLQSTEASLASRWGLLRLQTEACMPLIRPRVVRSDKPGPGRIMVSASEQDSLLRAILKWIPVEVITSYKVIMGLIPAAYGSGRLL